MDSISVTLVSVQLALIIFLLERLFTLKKCLSSEIMHIRERLSRIEATLKLLDEQQ